MISDKLNDYINTHPRQCLWILVIGLIFIWQSAVAVLGLSLYLIVKKYLPFRWWMVLLIGVFIAIISTHCSHHTIVTLFHDGLISNAGFWRHLFDNDLCGAFVTLKLNYLFGYPLLVCGMLSTIDLIPDNPYEHEMSALHKQHNNLPEKKEKIYNCLLIVMKIMTALC